MFNDLGDQYLVDCESRDVIFLCGKFVGDGLDSSQSSLDFTALALLSAGFMCWLSLSIAARYGVSTFLPGVHIVSCY